MRLHPQSRYRPQRGNIAFDGADVSKLSPATRTKLGIARTFQNIALFRGMTVLDNLLIGRHVHQKEGVLAGGAYYGPARREEIANREIVEDIIEFLEIQHIRKKTVGTLAYGLQKRVELARALALEPGNAKALYRKGLAFSMLGRHEEAVTCLENALKSDPTIADAWVVMSNSCFMLGKLEESARAFDQAYYIDVKDVRTGVVKGLSLLKTGKFDDALRSFSDVFGVLLR